MIDESSTPAPGDEPVFSVADAPDEGRFELRRDGELLGYANYSLRDNTVIVPHVETIREHRGNGYAARLMDGMLAILRDEERTITPLCSFARGHIQDNPAHHDLVA